MTDLQIVAAGLSGYAIPSFFIPVTDPAPVAPMSLFDKFGTEANNPDYWHEYSNYYSEETNTWSTDDLTIVPQTLRDDVADWVVVINDYNAADLAWKVNYEVQKDVQWRFKLAESILA